MEQCLNRTFSSLRPQPHSRSPRSLRKVRGAWRATRKHRSRRFGLTTVLLLSGSEPGPRAVPLLWADEAASRAAPIAFGARGESLNDHNLLSLPYLPLHQFHNPFVILRRVDIGERARCRDFFWHIYKTNLGRREKKMQTVTAGPDCLLQSRQEAFLIDTEERFNPAGVTRDDRVGLRVVLIEQPFYQRGGGQGHVTCGNQDTAWKMAQGSRDAPDGSQSLLIVGEYFNSFRPTFRFSPGGDHSQALKRKLPQDFEQLLQYPSPGEFEPGLVFAEAGALSPGQDDPAKTGCRFLHETPLALRKIPRARFLRSIA